MDEKLLNTLLHADHPTACEAPPDFDWERAFNRVLALQKEIESITGRTFEVDKNVQDASFFTDLATYDEEPRPQGGTLRLAVLALRFSAFGDLFTTWTVCHSDAKIDPQVVEKVVSVAIREGFVYIPADELGVEYTGPNRHLAGMSWWIRFFDYL